jgi:FAD-dependent monooxygenase
VKLADGSSLLDRFVDGFTLLAFGSEAERAAEPISTAAAELGVPLSVLRVDDTKAREIYERDLVLVRPDGHVAWRGASAPDDPMAILSQVTGHVMHNV